MSFLGNWRNPSKGEGGFEAASLDRQPELGSIPTAALSLLLLSILTVGALFGSEPSSPSLSGTSERGLSLALLIGIERYKSAPLMYVSNDVRRLEETLKYRGDYVVTSIIDSPQDRDETAADKPISERDLLMRRIERWLNEVQPNDRVLLYFSGHGFRDKDGTLYLGVIDCDPTDPVSGGVPVLWLRDQLSRCPASFKLLLLDSCHAGSEKSGTAEAGLSPLELGLPFKQANGVATLASCQGDEISFIWSDKEQSLFSYWLNQGLRGHADSDGDAGVDIDELYNFLDRQVPVVARREFGREQTPARIIGAGVQGVPKVIRPQPLTLKGLLGDMAEQLATELQLNDYPTVAVPEFAADTPLGEMLSRDYGALARYCANELEGNLADRSTNQYKVVSSSTVHEALATKGLLPADLTTSKALVRVTVDKIPVPALALGVLRDRTGQRITLQCRLVDAETQQFLGRAGGVALLNESEWAMLGDSAAIDQTAFPADRSRSEAFARSGPERFAPSIHRLSQQARSNHPMADPDFPFRVRVVVDGQFRHPIFRGNQAFVPLSRGETYYLVIENRADHSVFLRLLVDGLNTLPELVRPPGPFVTSLAERARSARVWLPAQRVNLAEAQAWQPQARPPGKKAALFGCYGFYSKVGTNGRTLGSKFVVVDSQDAEATRQGFTDQLGLITAAFYRPRPKGARGLGTAMGPEYECHLETYDNDTCPGNLLAVIHLRYVDPRSLPK